MTPIQRYRTVRFGVGRDRAAYVTLMRLPPQISDQHVYLAFKDGTVWCHACVCKHYRTARKPEAARLNLTQDLTCSSCGTPIPCDYQGDYKW